MSLKERREIVALHRATGTGGVLISLIGVSGSSYRRPGARLLHTDDGSTAGTLSGGCLEAELLRRANWHVRNGAVVEHVSTAFDDTAEIPYGLGCGGELDLLLEPRDAPEAAALLEALHDSLQGHHRTIATCIPGNGRSLFRFVLDATGDVLFASDELPTEDIVDLRSVARRAEHDHRATVIGYDLLVEHLRPAQRLVIFGAGEDARPLARMASEMGWSVTVADGRANLARADRFPTAHDVLVAAHVDDVRITRDDAVVVMTHSYEQDRRLLAQLLPLAPRYLGLLGARHRSALLLQEAAEMARLPLATAVERTHAPIGLQTGGDGPEAVALAIVAEIQHTLACPADHAPAARRMSAADAERILNESSTQLRAALQVGDSCAL